MPQLKTFSGFASTPDVGGTYVGMKSVMQREKEAAINADIARQKIASEMAQAQMEAAYRQQALTQKSLQDAQEIEIQRAYNESILGLKGRELQVGEDALNMKADEASRKYAAQESIRREIQKAISNNEPFGEAKDRAYSLYGAAAELPSAAYGSGASGRRSPVLNAQDIPGMPGFSAVETSDGHYQVFDMRKADSAGAVPVPGAPGKLKFGDSIFDDPQYKRIENDITRIQSSLNNKESIPKRMAFDKMKSGGQLSDAETAFAFQYANDLNELKKAQRSLSELGARHTPRSSTNKVTITGVRKKGD